MGQALKADGKGLGQEAREMEEGFWVRAGEGLPKDDTLRNPRNLRDGAAQIREQTEQYMSLGVNRNTWGEGKVTRRWVCRARAWVRTEL